MIYDTPTNAVYVVLQDHGPDDGGWGIAAWEIPGMGGGPHPLVYGGTDPTAIGRLGEMAQQIAGYTNKPTKFVRYTNAEDIWP